MTVSAAEGGLVIDLAVDTSAVLAVLLRTTSRRMVHAASSREWAASPVVPWEPFIR